MQGICSRESISHQQYLIQHPSGTEDSFSIFMAATSKAQEEEGVISPLLQSVLPENHTAAGERGKRRSNVLCALRDVSFHKLYLLIELHATCLCFADILHIGPSSHCNR